MRSTNVLTYLLEQNIPEGDWYCPSCRPKPTSMARFKQCSVNLSDVCSKSAESSIVSDSDRLLIMITIVIAIVIVKDSVYGAAVVEVHCHCKSSLGSFDKCSRHVQGDRQSLYQVDQSDPIDPPIGSYSDYIHHRHLLLLSPKPDTRFTIPRRVEG